MEKTFIGHPKRVGRGMQTFPVVAGQLPNSGPTLRRKSFSSFLRVTEGNLGNNTFRQCHNNDLQCEKLLFNTVIRVES